MKGIQMKGGVFGLLLVLIFVVAGVLYYSYYKPYHESEEGVVKMPVDTTVVANGIHIPTGLIADDGVDLIIANCTACHSAKLITQNRATRNGWKNTIVWMQQTQKLWDLGDQEEKILDYLAKNYAPEEQGRRKPLVVEAWYELK